MYLVAIHVPIYVDGNSHYLATDWLQSLYLLRDSFQGEFGKIAVIAPTRPSSQCDAGQVIEQLNSENDGIEVIASFDNRCRAREFWLKHRPQWCAQLREAVSRASVVHAGLDDLYKPISYQGFLEAKRQGRLAVLVQDTDIVLQTSQLNANRDPVTRTKAYAYARLFSNVCHRAVRRADLALLKGSSLMKRYANQPCNAKLFHDTSFRTRNIVSQESLANRCTEMEQRLQAGGAVRLVFAGRLTARKGLADSISIVAKAVEMGSNVLLDVIGDGEQLCELRELTSKLGMCDRVRFLGSIRYGEPLFERLRGYDALIFTPEAEDTPRMIFDGYAAGLPLFAYDVEYVRERASEESATLLLPFRNVDGAARRLTEFIRTPSQITALSDRAREAAIYHSADNWYKRRAEWTIEAFRRQRYLSDSQVPLTCGAS